MGNRVKFHCAVIGAGVIGTAVALDLRRDGHEVTLIEREKPAAGASFGNSGAIVNGSCAPTALPGVWKEAARALVDPLAPFSLRGTYALKATPWLCRFLLASRRTEAERLGRSLYSLTRHATEAWRSLSRNTPMAEYLHDSGWLKVYESRRAFDGTLTARSLLDACGSSYEVIDAAGIRELEPALAPIFTAGILQTGGLRISDPGGLVDSMVDTLVAEGGSYRQGAVSTILPERDQVAVTVDGRKLTADRCIVATGPWSKPLAEQLGDRVPLDAERGYHIMLPPGSESLLHRPVLNGDRAFVLSPMCQGMRMTSQSEIAGIDAPPDYRRIRSLLPEAKRMLPELDASEQSVWMGGRPSLPDSLPVIGPSSATPNVLYAFGHQHLGMTLAAITGRLISDLVARRDPAVDPTPFRADRF